MTSSSVKDLKLYSLLELDPKASQRDIEQAYRKMAMRYHPDRHANSEENKQEMTDKFKEITRAKEILSDPRQRLLYDQTGETKFRPNLSSVFKHGCTSSSDSGNGNGHAQFSDFFRQAANPTQTQQRQSRTKAPPINATLKLTLEDVYKGKTTHVYFDRSIMCLDCRGCGGSDIEICSQCRGSGNIKTGRKVRGNVVSEQVESCQPCEGKGEIIGVKCKKCSGNGNYIEKAKEAIEIPAGTKSRDVIELANKGNITSFRREQGDVKVTVDVANHSKFERQGNNLIYKTSIFLFEALCGGSFVIEHLDGHQIVVQLKKIVQPNQLYYIHHEGMPIKSTGSKGDLIIKLNINFPARLTDEEKQQLSVLLKRKVVPPKIKENHYETELKPYHCKLEDSNKQEDDTNFGNNNSNTKTNTFFTTNGNLPPEMFNGMFGGSNFNSFIQNILQSQLNSALAK